MRVNTLIATVNMILLTSVLHRGCTFRDSLTITRRGSAGALRRTGMPTGPPDALVIVNAHTHRWNAPHCCRTEEIAYKLAVLVETYRPGRCRSSTSAPGWATFRSAVDYGLLWAALPEPSVVEHTALRESARGHFPQPLGSQPLCSAASTSAAGPGRRGAWRSWSRWC